MESCGNSNMAKLQKDILSEEERLSGFDVGEPDDDTFALGDSDYFEDIEEIFDKPKEPEQIPDIEPDKLVVPVDDYDHDKELAPDSKDDDSNSTVATVPLIVEMPKSDEAKKDEEEEDKKAFPILLIAGIVAALLLISLTVIYFVYLPLSHESSEIAADSVKTIQESAPAQVEKDAEPIAAIATDSIEKVEEAIPEPAPEPEPKVVAKAMVEKKLDAPPSKPEATPVKPIEQPKATSIKPVEQPQAKTTTEVQKPKVQTDKVIADKKPAAKTEIPKVKEAPKKEEDIVSIIPERKTETKKPFVRDNVKEEFTVQIYASPSKEDANRWLEKLRAKSVNDAFISEQMIRDVKWYRVRFGQYDSRDEAKAAALRYGFAQTWIDRVK